MHRKWERDNKNTGGKYNQNKLDEYIKFNKYIFLKYVLAYDMKNILPYFLALVINTKLLIST